MRWPERVLFPERSTFRLAECDCTFGPRSAHITVWAAHGHVFSLECAQGMSGLSISGPLGIASLLGGTLWGTMIFEDQFNAARTSNLLLSLCLEFPSSEWEVFEPQYLGFASEAEYDARTIKVSKYERAFLLSSGELQKFVTENAIGFDWTDLRVLHDGREILYLQNVDSAKWYGKTDDVNVMRILDVCGLSNSGLADLPFPPWPRL